MSLEFSWDVVCIVGLSSVDIFHKDVHVLIVVLWFNFVAVQQVSLKGWILDVQDIIVKLLQLRIGHLLCINGEEVSKDDLKLFSADVTTSVFDLLA